MTFKKYWYNPPHLFIDDTPYFITAAIYQKRPLLQSPQLKQQLLNTIQKYFEQYQWQLHHWVILDNHYHLLGKSRKGSDLANIFRDIHSVSGYHIKKATQTHSQVWWNYWDYCPRDDKDYGTHLNYLFNNPIKHGYVNNLHDYPYSSFQTAMQNQGRDVLLKQFKDYSDYKKLVLEEDNF